MRTSLNEIKETEDFLTNKMNPGEELFFQAKIITHPILKLNVKLQSTLMHIVLHYQRKKLKSDLKSIHHSLLTSPDKSEFQVSIKNIFNA